VAHLLYSAKDREGKPVQGFVDAASVAAGREQLRARGLADVVMHQDTTVATDPKALEGLGPKELRELARISIAAMQQPGLGPVLKQTARVNIWWLLLDVGFIVWGVLSASPWLIAGGAVLAVLPFALAAWQYRHGDRYNALLKAFAVGDWKQVERLVALLRPASRNVDQLPFDLDMRLAAIAARKGRLPEALASLEPWREKLALQPGLFEQRVAAIHYAGEDRAGYVRLMAEAHAMAPQEPSRTVDLALAEARFGDAGRAAELLAAVDVSLLPPYAGGFIAWIDGLAKLRLQQPGGLERLAEGVASFLRLAPGQPAVWSSLAFCTCDHAKALSMAGRKDEARRELAEVWPILRAHGDRALLRLLKADGIAPP
jgi:hypothetical protein